MEESFLRLLGQTRSISDGVSGTVVRCLIPRKVETMGYLFTDNWFLRERVPYDPLGETIEVIVYLILNLTAGEVGSREPGH